MTPNIIEVVINRLAEVYKPREIYLFGSYAWGQPGQQSDLDLLAQYRVTLLHPLRCASYR
jgi:predicted nucleotidyltransferase